METRYVGTKRINAHPKIKDGVPGYHVIYSKDTDDEYHSWSPKEVFEAAYCPVNAMNFGHALELLKDGHRVAREGWNGKGMFIFLVPGSTFTVNRAPLLGIYPEGTVIDYHGHVDMKTADGKVVPWLCSQTDMLADDWMLVD